MKQSLQLRLGQQLTMTPQLQQAIRLLQLSTLDLKQEIQEALDSNMMLETEEEGAAREELNGSDGQLPGELQEGAGDQASNQQNDTNNEREVNGESTDIPQELAVKHTLLPLFIQNKTLYVVMENPLDSLVLREIRKTTRLQVIFPEHRPR